VLISDALPLEATSHPWL